MENNLTGTQPTAESSRTEWSPGGNGGFSDGEGVASPDAITKTAGGLNETGHEYTDRISQAVAQAKDYLGDKVSTVGERIKEFATDDLSGLAGKAKDFARQKPGEAILVSAAVGVLLGLIIRGRR